MRIKMKAKVLPQPETVEELKKELHQKYGSLSKAAEHYQMAQATLRLSLRTGRLSQEVARILSNDYNLKKLQLECQECGAFYFGSTSTTETTCSTCTGYNKAIKKGTK